VVHSASRRLNDPTIPPEDLLVLIRSPGFRSKALPEPPRSFLDQTYSLGNNGFKVSSSSTAAPASINTSKLPLPITTAPSSANSTPKILLRSTHNYTTATTTADITINTDSHQTYETERSYTTGATEIHSATAMSRLRRTKPTDQSCSPGMVSRKARDEETAHH